MNVHMEFMNFIEIAAAKKTAEMSQLSQMTMK